MLTVETASWRNPGAADFGRSRHGGYPGRGRTGSRSRQRNHGADPGKSRARCCRCVIMAALAVIPGFRPRCSLIHGICGRLRGQRRHASTGGRSCAGDFALTATPSRKLAAENLSEAPRALERRRPSGGISPACCPAEFNDRASRATRSADSLGVEARPTSCAPTGARRRPLALISGTCRRAKARYHADCVLVKTILSTWS